MSHSILAEIIDTLNELERMHQLNYELLEQLNVACGYLRENKLSLPNGEKFANLLSKAMALLAEIQAKAPKMLQYQKLADERKQHFRTDGEVTEPLGLVYDPNISEVTLCLSQKPLCILWSRFLIKVSRFFHAFRSYLCFR
jgi:hypothetical protein